MNGHHDPRTLHRVSQEVTTPPARVFNLDDDAFNSDGEDEGFKFSMDSVRQDLAEASWMGSGVGESEEGDGDEPNLSVSTLDLEASTFQEHVSQMSRSDSMASENFAHVSLNNEDEAQYVEYPSKFSEPPPIVQVEDLDALQEHPPTPPLHSPAIHFTPSLLNEPQSPPRTPHSAPAHSPGLIPLASTSTLDVPPPTPRTAGHRPSRSTGISTMDIISKTRPTHLPPKTRQEDRKHMQDWEAMMRLSRASADKRRQALQDRRIVREKKIEDSLHIWERDIAPDWRVVHKNTALRKLWWGGIPTRLRASMWERAVGNALSLSKDSYRTCLARAKRALATGTFPPATLELIEQDMATTLPALHIFHSETGPLYQDLKDMLCAWVVSRADEGLGYTPGASKVAAMFLINMSPPQGFVVMRNLMERHCMRSFYGGSAASGDVEAYYRIFDTLLADGMPKIYFNFKQHQISPSSYLLDWLLPLFLDHLPFEACARVWDVLLLEGDSFLYRAALGILAVLEPRLFFPERKELMELLKGENKAALDVAIREGVPLDGGKYAIYGVDEETLWERIDSMDEWWKESTWKRLIQRELPTR